MGKPEPAKGAPANLSEAPREQKSFCGVKAPTSIGSHGASPAPVKSYLLEIVPCERVRVRACACACTQVIY